MATDDKIEDLTLVQLRGMRREMAALLEQQARMFEHITRLYKHTETIGDRVEARLKGVEEGLREIRSDIITLEMQNLSRHGETLNILRKLEGNEDRS